MKVQLYFFNYIILLSIYLLLFIILTAYSNLLSFFAGALTFAENFVLGKCFAYYPLYLADIFLVLV